MQSDTHQALQLRRSDTIASVEVGTLDVLERADMIRGRLAKYGKKLDESAFNNQVPRRFFSFSWLLFYWCVFFSVVNTDLAMSPTGFRLQKSGPWLHELTYVLLTERERPMAIKCQCS